jgi:hypothetical protein
MRSPCCMCIRLSVNLSAYPPKFWAYKAYEITLLSVSVCVSAPSIFFFLFHAVRVVSRGLMRLETDGCRKYSRRVDKSEKPWEK